MLNDPNFKSQFNNMTKIEKEKVEKEIKKNSQEALYLFYISRKIIMDNTISITKEEIREIAKKYLNPNQRLVLDYVPKTEKE